MDPLIGFLRLGSVFRGGERLGREFRLRFAIGDRTVEIARRLPRNRRVSLDLSLFGTVVATDAAPLRLTVSVTATEEDEAADSNDVGAGAVEIVIDPANRDERRTSLTIEVVGKGLRDEGKKARLELVFGSGVREPGPYEVPLPAPAPQLASVSPASGPLQGGNSVTVLGASFVPGCVAKFGGVDAATTLVTSTALTAVVPAGSAAGPVAVQVRNPDGRAGALQSGYAYTSASLGALRSGITPQSDNKRRVAAGEKVTFIGSVVLGPGPNPDAMLTLSVSGLPAGWTSNFPITIRVCREDVSPPGCGDYTLEVTTSVGTPPGSYELKVGGQCADGRCWPNPDITRFVVEILQARLTLTLAPGQTIPPEIPAGKAVSFDIRSQRKDFAGSYRPVQTGQTVPNSTAGFDPASFPENRANPDATDSFRFQLDTTRPRPETEGTLTATYNVRIGAAAPGVQVTELALPLRVRVEPDVAVRVTTKAATVRALPEQDVKVRFDLYRYNFLGDVPLSVSGFPVDNPTFTLIRSTTPNPDLVRQRFELSFTVPANAALGDRTLKISAAFNARGGPPEDTFTLRVIRPALRLVSTGSPMPIAAGRTVQFSFTIERDAYKMGDAVVTLVDDGTLRLARPALKVQTKGTTAQLALDIDVCAFPSTYALRFRVEAKPPTPFPVEPGDAVVELTVTEATNVVQLIAVASRDLRVAVGRTVRTQVGFKRGAYRGRLFFRIPNEPIEFRSFFDPNPFPEETGLIQTSYRVDLEITGRKPIPKTNIEVLAEATAECPFKIAPLPFTVEVVERPVVALTSSLIRQGNPGKTVSFTIKVERTEYTGAIKPRVASGNLPVTFQVSFTPDESIRPGLSQFDCVVVIPKDTNFATYTFTVTVDVDASAGDVEVRPVTLQLTVQPPPIVTSPRTPLPDVDPKVLPGRGRILREERPPAGPGGRVTPGRRIAPEDDGDE